MHTGRRDGLMEKGWGKGIRKRCKVYFRRQNAQHMAHAVHVGCKMITSCEIFGLNQNLMRQDEYWVLLLRLSLGLLTSHTRVTGFEYQLRISIPTVCWCAPWEMAGDSATRDTWVSSWLLDSTDLALLQHMKTKVMERKYLSAHLPFKYIIQ